MNKQLIANDELEKDIQEQLKKFKVRMSGPGSVEIEGSYNINLNEKLKDTSARARFEEAMQDAFEDMGLSEAAAKIAARGRNRIEEEVNDDNFGEALTDAFMMMGMQESTAKIAAKGRD